MRKEIEQYICKNPEYSNILAFQNFCKKRLLGIDMLFSIVNLLLGGNLIIFSVRWIYYDHLAPNLSDQQFHILLQSPIQLVSLVWLFCTLLILPHGKWKSSNLKFFVMPTLLTALTFSIYSYSIESILLDHKIMFWCVSAICVLGSVYTAISLISLETIINEYNKSKKDILSTYEYNSEQQHTGIIIPINSKRLAESSSAEAQDPLVKTLFKLKAYPYRVYFCFTKNEVEKVITDPQIINLWIFGHGSRGSVDVADGPFYYDSLKYRDIPKKGYIQQYHCNGWIDEHDNTSLVDLLVDENDRKRSTDTGTQNWFLRQLCKCPLISRIGNYFLNTRNLKDNKKGIKQYLLELENTD